MRVGEGVIVGETVTIVDLAWVHKGSGDCEWTSNMYRIERRDECK